MPWQTPRIQQLILLSGLYAAQGLPFGFFTMALPVLMREAGWSLTSIGFLHFLALPWALKFLWAPLVDHHGTRRGWLLFLQCAGCAMALALSQIKLDMGGVALFAAVMLFNLIAATQDVVTDGLAVRLLDAKERGLANGVQIGAYRLGMILGGGLLLWVYAQFGWHVMFGSMAAMLALTILPVLTLREPPPLHAPEADSGPSSTSKPRGWRLLLGWVHRAKMPGMVALGGLIICYRLGDQMIGAVLLPFITDQGVPKETIAVMKGTVGSATSLVGAALGGWLAAHGGRRRALLIGGLAQAAGFGFYIAVALGLGGVALLWAATLIEGIVGTMAAVALFSVMMDAADPQHPGTDYTLLSCVVAMVSGLGSIAGGMLGDAVGYAPTLIIATVLSALGCLFVVWWLDRHPTHDRVAQAWR